MEQDDLSAFITQSNSAAVGGLEIEVGRLRAGAYPGRSSSAP